MDLPPVPSPAVLHFVARWPGRPLCMKVARKTTKNAHVATLAHETLDDAVEFVALEAKTLFARAQAAKVLSRLGRNVIVQFNDHLARRSAANGNVEKHASVCTLGRSIFRDGG